MRGWPLRRRGGAHLDEPPFSLQVTEVGEEAHVMVAGACDAATEPLLRACLDQLVGRAETRTTVVVDLRNCSLIDSMAVAVLVDTHRRLEEQRRSLVIANASGIVREALRMTGVDGFLHVVE